MTLSGIAVRRPVLAFVANALIVVFGIMAYRNLPLRELPDVDPPLVSVDTSYPGANAEVVENRITQVIEDQLSGLQGVKQISSTSRDGRSSVNIEFKLSRDLEAAANDVRDAVSRAAGSLPEQVELPRVRKQDADAQPIMWFGLTSPTRDVAELTDYARRFVVDRLSVVDGVSFVRLGGEQEYAMRIWTDRRAMAARGLTVGDIEQALRQQNVELPAGELETGAMDLRVRVERAYVRAEEFARMPIATGADGHVIRLGEVARVELGPAERRSLFRGNGQPRLGLGIVRQSKANELEVAAAVRAEIERIQDGLPDDLSIVLNYDGTQFVGEAIREVWRTLAIALVLVVGVIYLFLGSVRAAIIPAIVAPLALVGVFAILAALGFSLNILTLLAMVLAIGLVVDDSIVVLENIQRRIDFGEPPLVGADRGANQVFFAVVATTAVVVAVFAPLATLQGYLGKIFVELAVTISGAVIISSFVALTLSPAMAARLLRPATDARGPARWVGQALDATRVAYRGALELCMRARLVFVLLLGFTLVGVGVLYTHLERELVPAEDRGGMFVSFTAPQGASYEYTVERALEVEKLLLEYVESGEARVALVRVPGFGGTGYNSGVSIFILNDFDKRDRSGLVLVGELNRRLGEIPGVRAFAGMRSSLAGGGGNDIEFVIGGDDYDSLAAAADALVERASTNPGLLRVRKSYEATSPRTIVEPDRERAAALGVTLQAIGQALEAQLGGRRVGAYVDGGEEYEVLLQNELDDRRTASDLSNIFVRSQTTGQLAPLSNLVRTFEVGEAPARPRINRVRAVTVTATLAEGYALGSAVEWFQTEGRDALPGAFSTEFVGTARELGEAESAAIFAFAMAMLIVFLVLAAQFESFIHPFVIMLTVPFAMAGGLFGLLMVGASLNIYSQVGLIILVGLAAKNGILIVEFANQLREAGRSVRDAVLEASATRLRPVLMTGVSTALGALPLVLASGAGAESRITIGIVIFVGVSIATLFTLVVVPVFYDLLAGLTRPTGHVGRQIADYERAAQAPAE